MLHHHVISAPVRRKQAGFALLELAIALALSAMLLIWASNRLVHEVEDSAARSSGVWLAEIKRAIDQMLVGNFDMLAAGSASPPVGQAAYANPLAPTLSELKQQGHLPAGFPEVSTLGFGVDIRVLRAQACPGAGCRLDALAYSRKPVLGIATNAPGLMQIAEILTSAQGYAGAVTTYAPARLRGANFDFPNPFLASGPALAPGSVAIWSSLDDVAYQQYLRLKDPRDPQFQGSVSVKGNIAAGKRLSAKEHLLLEAVNVAGSSCGANPGLVSREASGTLLTCQSGVWTRDSGGFGGAYSTNYPYGCRHYSGVSTANPRTSDCSCPSGYNAVIVSAGGIWKETEGWTTGYVCVR